MTDLNESDAPALAFPALPIETERLSLRLFTLDDLPSTHAYNSLDEVARYLPYTPKNLEQARDSLQKVCATVDWVENGGALVLAVVEKASNAMIGEVMLFYRNAKAGQAEVGYVFHPSFHGKGYAFEAVERIVDLGFTHFGMHRIFGRCSAANGPSAKLMQKLGMRLEAHFREHELFKGEWDELKIFAILENEWTARKGQR